jgi:hypothetical protein
MKALLISICCLLFLAGNGQEDSASVKDTLVEKLKELELDKFVKHKTETFLSLLPAGYKLEITPANKRGYAYTAVVTMPERPYLEIYLHYHGFVYTNPNSFLKKKQRRQLRMERISEINIYHEFMCVNGCD